MAGFTFSDLKDFEAWGKSSVKKGNDRMYREGDKIKVSYRGNDIAEFDTKTRKMNISSAGWYSHTTKDRLNKILPYHYVTQAQGDWYLVNRNGQAIPFKNGMVVDQFFEGKPLNEILKEKNRALRLTKQIQKLDEGNMFVTVDGKTYTLKDMRDWFIQIRGFPSILVFGTGDAQIMGEGQSGGRQVTDFVHKVENAFIDKYGASKYNEGMDKLMHPKETVPVPLKGMQQTKVQTLGSQGSGWHKEPVSHSYATKYGKAPARVRGR
jgi:hypothetical protein